MDKTLAIEQFLKRQAVKADLYSPKLEVQVKGVESYRIPFKGRGIDAEPTYTGSEQTDPFEPEAIGLTGWNWLDRKSMWVGFDFDSIATHSKGLSDQELDDIRQRVANVPWITLRRSKSGKGYHLYVTFKEPVSTRNHTEHAALAYAILSLLSGLINFNFHDKVDAVGGILWIWHKDGSKEKRSFEVIKQGVLLEQVPENWKNFLNRKKSPIPKDLEELLKQVKRSKLDDDHRDLINWFAKQTATWWWDADLEMLVCHTADLFKAHKELNLKGIFETISKGKDTPADQNCFAFPMPNGAWVIRRHSLNTQEHAYWSKDQSGWTRCFYNKHPDLATVSKMYDGVKTKNGSFVFNKLENATLAVTALGGLVDIEDEEIFKHREAVLSKGSSDSELVLAFKAEDSDPNIPLFAKVRKKWETTINIAVDNTPVEPPDELIRYTTRENTEDGWYIFAKNWIRNKKDNVKDALIALNYPKNEIDNLLGQCIFNPWAITSLPFQPEYPGNRQWNRDAAQLAYNPTYGNCPTWDKILQHIGKNINVEGTDWCKINEITTGFHYLLYWVASLFQNPTEPLPYLFIYGDQNTGKSILHEALSLLFKHNKGYVRADNALTNPNGYNGELYNAVLCVIEEIDLGKNAKAADRLKDWVTARLLSIRALYTDPFMTINTTHWIQCANNSNWCPIFPGDTRINVIYVSPLEQDIPKPKLLEALRGEAPAFLNKIMKLRIPESDSRLRIPVLQHTIKIAIEQKNESALDVFLKTRCEQRDGCYVSFKDFYKAFIGSIDSVEANQYSPKRVGMDLPIEKFPKGRWGTEAQIHIGNIIVQGIDVRKVDGKFELDKRGYLSERGNIASQVK